MSRKWQINDGLFLSTKDRVGLAELHGSSGMILQAFGDLLTGHGPTKNPLETSPGMILHLKST